MNRKRKCVLCGRVRNCRLHTGQCKNGIQSLCLECARDIAKNWYEKNKSSKILYAQIYRKRGAFLRSIGKRFSDLTEKEKMELL